MSHSVYFCTDADTCVFVAMFNSSLTEFIGLWRIRHFQFFDF